MGLIVIHAGMPKCGSTSIQGWLRAEAHALARRGVRYVALRPRDASPDARYTDARHIKGYEPLEGFTDADAVERMLQDLDVLAHRHDVLLASREGLARLFWNDEHRFPEQLDQLARRHHVRVVYYVRPQHTALEAAWREWGFRRGLPPSVYVERRSDHLRYLQTWERMRRLAPDVHFDVWPFRSDALVQGDVVADFAHRVLDLEPGRAGPTVRVNVGRSLDVANFLGDAPLGLFWDSLHDERRLGWIDELMQDWDVPESEAAKMSRVVLHSYALAEFEDDNRRLAAAVDWPIDHLVPPRPAGRTGPSDITLLDQLWRSPASQSEKAAFYAALDELLRLKRDEGRTPRRGSRIVPSLLRRRRPSRGRAFAPRGAATAPARQPAPGRTTPAS